MEQSTTLLYAFLGGLLPALIWLWFFLKEDSKRPEPKWIIVAAFLSGMFAVILALPLEMLGKCIATGTWPTTPFWYAHTTLSGTTPAPFGVFSYCAEIVGVTPIFLWAATEELLKYAVALAVILWRRAVDEPIDAMVYLITVALGFAAFETALFLLEPLGRGDITNGILTGNLRFMGAALIHTLASAVVGFAIALTFYRSYIIQCFALCTGLILASVLHALFNHHIIVGGGERNAIVFFAVWLGVICLFLMFEKAKKITYFTRPQL
ncbi:MAG: PrsW family intramembrane metalloprotease [Candidatus Pacebacteria bacterium]|nr:PrsW family intramembrane metalloprotease [Candidatus Paceibacterota bacterium]